MPESVDYSKRRAAKQLCFLSNPVDRLFWSCRTIEFKKGMSPAHVVNFTRHSWVISAQQIVMHRQLAIRKAKEKLRFSDIYAIIAVGDIMNEHDFAWAARWFLAQGLPVFPLIQTDEAARNISFDLSACHAGVLTGSASGIDSWAEGDPRSVFLSACAAEENLQAAHGRCRYLAQTPEEIQKLDTLVGPLLPEGYMEDIAIRVWPQGGGAFTAENIPSFARLIRRTEHLAVRALFLPFDQSGDLSRQAKDAFSLVKKIRSDMPCMLHAFCFEGLLQPLAQGDTELLRTIQMLASLNETSLYASFFLS